MLSILFGYIFLCTTSWAQTSKVDSSEMVTLRIDPDAARGAAASQIFDEVKFIPLETTKESLFGSISQLKIADDNFIIFDYDTKSVLIFSNDGKFKNKIDGNKIPKSDNDKESNGFYGFELVKVGEENQIMIYTGKSRLFYSLAGVFIKKIPSKDWKFNQKKEIEKSDYTYERGWIDKKDKDSLSYAITFFKKDSLVAKYFPFDNKRYDTDLFYGTGGQNSEDFSRNYFITKFYEYNIYKVVPPLVKLNYRIIFPANISLPPNFMDEPAFVGRDKRMAFFEKNKGLAYGLGNVYQTGDNLWFKLGYSGGGLNKKNSLIFNVKTGELTSMADIEPDTLTYFLPVTDADKGYDFYSRGFLLYKDDYFYTSYSSLAMFAFKEQSAGKNPKYNEALTNYFKTQDRKSNPIIVQLKPKNK